MIVNFPSVTPKSEISTVSDEGKIQSSFITNSNIILVPIVTSATIVGLQLILRKKVFKIRLNKKPFFRLAGTILFGILLSSTIVTAIPLVSADTITPNSKSRIYAAYYSDPPQEQSEIDAANWLAGQIEYDFESSGYSADDLTGGGTTKANVYACAQNDELHYDRVAVFHFGHLFEFNNAYQDNIGNPINSSELDNFIDTNKHKFVFIWVCTQAETQNLGMPAAWTQRTDLQFNGYLHPDLQGQCYIGFHGISPQIGNNSGTFQNQVTGPVKNFIKLFYDYALLNSYSVRDALNLASISFFGSSFTSSILYGYDEPDYNSYEAWFPGYGEEGDENYLPPGFYPGSMRVFGDGSMWLFQPKITLTSNPSLSPTFYVDGQAFSSGDIHVWPTKTYTIDVSDVPGHVFDHFSYDGTNWGRPATTQLIHSGSLVAHYSMIPQQYSLTISAGSGGTTSPSPGTYWYDSGTPVQVTANEYTNYDFSYWTLDGQYYSSNPIATINMYDDHTLQAIFVEEQQNNPPTTPTLTGPQSPTYANQSYQFTAYSTDPEGDNIVYNFYWDDSTMSPYGFYTSGTIANASHSWSTTGIKNVTVKVIDTHNAWSDESNYTINIQSPSNDSQVGVWHFDEGSGSVAYDESVYENDGSISGASWTSGQVDDALSFDGYNDYVEVSHDDSITGFTEAFTVQAWIKMDNDTRRQAILQKFDSGGEYGWFVDFNDNDRDLQLFVSPDGSNYEHWGTYFNPQPSQWYHIAIVWEANQIPTFYINGDEKTTWGSGTVSQVYNNSGTPLYVGRCPYSSTRYFDGKIDEIQIYNQALTAQQIEDYYDSTN